MEGKMSLAEYEQQKARQRVEQERAEMVNKLESYKNEITNLYSQISQLNGIIRGSNAEVARLKESHAAELNGQKDGLNTVINNLNVENQGLKEIIAERDDKISELNEIKENVVPFIKSLEEKISSLKESIGTNNEVFLAEISELKGDIRDLPGEILTEIAKISIAQRDCILSEIAKINGEVSKQPENLKILLKDELGSISTKIDEKTDYLDESMDGVIYAIKEYIDLTIPATPPITMEAPKIEKPVPAKNITVPETDKLSNLSDSTRLVYGALTTPKTIKETAEATGIGERTVYRAVEELERRELVKSDNGRPEKFHAVAESF